MTAAKIETRNPKEVVAAGQQITGRPVSLIRLASLSGATGSATVKPKIDDGAFGKTIGLQVVDDKYDAYRRIYRDSRGKLVLKADNFFVKPEFQKQGIGRELFGRMVETALELGVDYIETYAICSPTADGYNRWPRFGYDADIPGPLLAELPPSLARCKRLSCLFRTEEGANWWKIKGVSIELRFSLKQGSKNLQRWGKYLRERTERP